MRFWLFVSLLFLASFHGAFAQATFSDTFDTSLAGWASVAGTAAWSPADSSGHATSGSAQLTNMLADLTVPAQISRCIAVTPPVASIVAGVRAQLVGGSTADGSPQLNIFFYTGSDCTGSNLNNFSIGIGSGTSWQQNLFAWTFSSPLANVHSVLIVPALYRSNTAASVSAVFDDVLFGVNAAAALNEDRFSVGVAWKTRPGQIGLGNPVELTTDSGYFWFFSPANIEVVVKVLNACALNDRYWVFAGGLTDVETFLTAVDNQGGHQRSYRNPQRQAFLPIQDTDALASCPED